MNQDFSIRILPEQAASEQTIKEFLIKEKALSPESIWGIRILRRSIDARQGHDCNNAGDQGSR